MLLFTAWVMQLDVGGLRCGAPMIYCPQPVISQTLDLNKIFVFFLHCCHNFFKDYLKTELPSLSFFFFESIK